MTQIDAQVENLSEFADAHIAVAIAESLAYRQDYRSLEIELPSLLELTYHLAESCNVNIASPFHHDVEIVEEPAILLIRLTTALADFLDSAGRIGKLNQLNKWSYIAASELGLWLDATIHAYELARCAFAFNKLDEMKVWLKRAERSNRIAKDAGLKANLRLLKNQLAIQEKQVATIG